MYTTIAAILAVLWLLGLVCGYTMGGAIHLLLIVAIIMVLGKRMGDRKRSDLSVQRARSRQLRRDLGAPKTWNLK
jgi:uncharacterized membrane protein YciS (DUF1049 family)